MPILHVSNNIPQFPPFLLLYEYNYSYTNTLELPHLPEMVFPNNVLYLIHSSGAQIEFNALDALRKVCNGKLPIKVACADVWKESR